MANNNVVAAYFGGTARGNLASVLTASNSETAVKLVTDSGTNATAVLAPPSQTSILGSGNPLSTEVNPAILQQVGNHAAGRPGFNSTSFDLGRPFLVRLAGTVKAAASAADITVLFKLYSGTFGGTATAIAATAANALNASLVTWGFLLEAELYFISARTTSNIHGQFWYHVDGTTASYNTWAVTTAADVASLAANVFTATYTWAGAGATGGTVAASEFSLTQL